MFCSRWKLQSALHRGGLFVRGQQATARCTSAALGRVFSLVVSRSVAHQLGYVIVPPGGGGDRRDDVRDGVRVILVPGRRKTGRPTRRRAWRGPSASTRTAPRASSGGEVRSGFFAFANQVDLALAGAQPHVGDL